MSITTRSGVRRAYGIRALGQASVDTQGQGFWERGLDRYIVFCFCFLKRIRHCNSSF